MGASFEISVGRSKKGGHDFWFKLSGHGGNLAGNYEPKCEGWKDGGTCENFWPLPSQVSTFSAVL